MVWRYVGQNLALTHVTVSEKMSSTDGRTDDDGRPRHDNSTNQS